MFEKINQLLKIKESLDELNKKVDGEINQFLLLKNENESFREDIQSIKKDLQEIQEGHASYLNELKKAMHNVKELKEDLESEIADFKVIRTKLNNDILNNLTVEFKNEFAKSLSKLDADIEKFNHLKKSLASVTPKIEEALVELHKFHAISKQIKETDFTLEKHGKALEDSNREKIELMKKIDALERLISRERRNG